MKKLMKWVWLAMLAASAGSGMAQTIPDKIDAILARSTVVANNWTILIENQDGSTAYYQRNPTTGLAPASNTKLFTSSTAFGLLGTNHYFETRIYLNGAFSGGVLTGDLNLVCEHDITWNTTVFPSSARTPLDHIAAQLKANGLLTVTGNVQCYGCCFYNLSDTDASNHDAANQAGYNLSAAAAFVAALQAQGITVSGSALGPTGFNVPGTLFYTHKSSDLTYGGQPLRLDVACIPMNKVSHNVMADGLLRHIGYIKTGTDSFAAGAGQVLPWLKNTAGLSTNGTLMLDGSGLSHSDSFSARQVVSLVRYMLGNFPSWKTTLPIGCMDGTIGGRFCSTDGSGQVHAKTGSLSISIALSGYIDNKYDNRRYLFSFISNKTSIDQANTRQAIDDCVVLLGGRVEAISPQLLYVTNAANNSLALKWSDEKFIRTGYRIYASADGVNFGAPINVASNVQTFTESGLATGNKRYYRVSVVGSGGESPFSRVYGAQASNARSHILVVDGYDRWQSYLTDNPAATNHNFSAVAGQSISGPAFDTAHHTAVTNGTLFLSNYQAVIWMLGEESTQERTFDANEQALVTAYLNAGGNLFVNGAEIGWDLDRPSGPATTDRDFYHNQLHALFFNDDANTYSFAPSAGGLFVGNNSGTFDNGTHGSYNVDFPDVLTPTNSSVAAILYSGGVGGAAAVQYPGTGNGGKVVNWGFPFETITSASVRDAYMSDVLRFLDVLSPPQLRPPTVLANNTGVALTWSTSSGLKYRVQYKENLSDANWMQVGSDVTATTTTTSLSDLNIGGTSSRFYRIMLVN
jgi:D-alanyl-D-alanine carboxypeptidase